MFPYALLFHLISLTIIAAGAIGSVVTFLAIRSALRAAPAAVPGIARMLPRFGMTAQIGALLMLISGTLLLYSRGWADWGAPWLTAKLTLFALLIVSSNVMIKPAGMKLGAAVATGAPTAPIVRRLSLIFVWQIAGFVTLIVLAVLGSR